MAAGAFDLAGCGGDSCDGFYTLVCLALALPGRVQAARQAEITDPVTACASHPLALIPL
ncbi:hypothetical protein [Agrobacterium fabrum]|uniref:hypothetical protein n=1 Tax=Agrobacterium fabrum TaxID=1176649 RepID=UPI003BA21A0E